MAADNTNDLNVAIDAVLFVISSQSLSKGALKRLEAAASASCDVPAVLIRLEETGPSLITALSQMRDAGHRSIRVQPVGVPFPEALLKWIPGVLADWRNRDSNADTNLFFGADPARSPALLEGLMTAALEHPAPLQSIQTVTPKLGKPGWEMPPDFDFHLLVCTGPRCAVHGAASFVDMLKEELAVAGITDRCLTTRTGCIYPCNKGPIVVLYPHGHWYRLPNLVATRRFVREVLVQGEAAEDLRFYATKVPHPAV